MNETGYCLLEETKHNDLMSEKHKNICRVLVLDKIK